MRNILFLLFLLFFQVSAHAQKTRIAFHSENYLGLLEGSAGTNISLQSINGVKIKNQSIGVGVGMDDYFYRSLPVYFDTRYYFGDKDPFLLYADAGYNFPLKNSAGSEVYNPANFHLNGGLYTDFGLGFQVPLSGKAAASFTFGYSFKKLENNTSTMICPLLGPCTTSGEQYLYRLYRLIIKAGIVF